MNHTKTLFATQRNTRTALAVFAAVLALALGTSSSARAATGVLPQQELVASDAAPGSYFGNSVAVDGDVMVVGAPDVDPFGPYGPGTAYVYRLSNGAWSEEAILTAGADAFTHQVFGGYTGEAVAVAGDTIVVGAPNDFDNGAYSGAAYVFTHDGSTWTNSPQKLVASDGEPYDNFGLLVSISDDGGTILVPAGHGGVADPGRVYVFEWNGTSYVESQTLSPPDGADYDQFGARGAKMAQNTIVISSWHDDNENGTGAGALYLYEWDSFTEQWEYDEKLLLADGQADWWFAWSVDISPDGNTIVASTAAGLEGGVYVFERSGASWAEVGALPHPIDSNSSTGDWLMGDMLALSNDTMVIGHSAMDQEIGGAYIYRRSGGIWALAHVLRPDDGVSGNYYLAPNDPDDWGDWAGTSVALSGANIAIGSPNHDDGGAQSGSVYFFRDPGPDPDVDTDGMSDDLEAGFGGTDPDDSLAITNPDTGDAAYATGSAEDGATIYSGSFGIELPAGTSVDTANGADQIQITLQPGAVSRVQVSGADLGSGTKSIIMPFDSGAQYPAVCIDDSPTATIDEIVVDDMCAGTSVAIPATVGASTTVPPFTVTRLLDSRAQVDGLSHTALATLDLGSAPPAVASIGVNTGLAPVGTTVTANASFSDADDGGSHVASWDWGDGEASAGTVDQGDNTVAGSHAYEEPGVYTVRVTVTDPDTAGPPAVAEHRYVVVYDPSGGFVTGGGWIDSPAGAVPAEPTLTGKATFGFVAKYKKGKTVPEGNTEFQFKAGSLNFKSTGDYMWLVVSGSGHKATYKGTGTVNGAGNYGFMVSVIDAANTPSTDADLFRIKIWDKDDGDAVVYDNQLGTSCYTGDDADACTVAGGGSIVIHKN